MAGAMSAFRPLQKLSLVLFALLSLCGSAAAQTGRDDRAAGLERNRVVLRVEGQLSAPERAGLSALLEADFTRRALVLSVADDHVDRRHFIDSRRTEASTLLIAVLHVRSRSSWQLSIVDAARGRAIVRALPGSYENAAALEEVASIVSSAASALRDGLEVASQSIDEAMPDAAPPPERPQTAVRAPDAATESPVGVRSSLAVGVASFAPQATHSTGFSAALGVRLGAVTPRLSGTRYLSTALDSSFGSFSVARTTFGLSVGRAFAWRELELEPELALLFDLLRRSSAAASGGVTASEDSSLHRVGGYLGFRLRWRLSRHVALEWTGGGYYFAERLRFLAATPQPTELAVPWRGGGSSQLGLEIRAP